MNSLAQSINALIIPLEEKELSARFDDDYRTYKEKVPGFFPVLPCCHFHESENPEKKVL